jgi:protein tyrosine phosphatase
MKIIDLNEVYQNRLDKENKFCRYSEVRTYKDNKVEINSDNGYINASWIHIPYHKSFIATQGPLESTIEDFWEMCYSYDIKVIVMLCKLDENYKEKCANYWDTNIKNFTIEKIGDTMNLSHDTKIRKFKVLKIGNNIEKIIYQIHFTCWADHSIPDNSYNEIINIINIVDKLKEDKPVVVHCSAGIGRTGTFISVYNLYHEILKQINNKNINELKFSIMNLVRKLKEMRLYLVENQTQYDFLYQFVNLVLLKNN